MKKIKPRLLSYLAVGLLSSGILNANAAFPDWSGAGYQENANLPTASNYSSDPSCIITASEMSDTFSVYANDGLDDTQGIQAAIDAIKQSCTGSYTELSLIQLPAGELHISRQLHVDSNFLIIKGAGSAPQSINSTKLIFEPDNNTRYDNISDFNLNDMIDSGGAKGGWIWPGRGVFRVQTRAIHSSYLDSYNEAPANRKDFYEGSVNFHWKNENITANANQGENTIQLSNIRDYQVGNYVWVGSANTNNFYQQQGVLPENRINSHMRQQIFKILAVDSANKRITLDKDLEFNVFSTNTGDGSIAIRGSEYNSRAVNLDVVEGVGFEDFYLTQVAPAGFTEADAKNNYNNIDHEAAMHGIVFKWAVNGFVKNVHIQMIGSHPIVTEMAKNLQFEDNYLAGSWNKGKGGNGYFRNSKLWDSLIKNNVIRDLRHLTLQWSASGNVVTGNNIDADINLHGGWERFNLIENNVVRVPFAHSDCSPNCSVGDETWYPIWYAPGEHAGRWSGSSGPRNVFFNNILQKQLSDNGSFIDFPPYGSDSTRIFQFGWDSLTPEGSDWRHLSENGVIIPFWTGRELLDYTQNDAGINANCTSESNSLLSATISCSDETIGDGDGDGDVTSCLIYEGGRQDFSLASSRCISVASGLTGRTVQLWNSKAGEGCGFKGEVTGSDEGSLILSASYASSTSLQGSVLQFSQGNSCPKIRVRVY